MYAVIVLPIAYLSVFLVIANWQYSKDWRQVALRAAVIWGAYLVFQLEILSLINTITPSSLILGWCLPIVVSGILLWRQVKISKKLYIPTFTRPENWADGILLAGLIFFLAVTALTAWIAPPNTFDSLNYHMSRVAHWSQNHSLRHFITGIEIENSQAPGAEFIILNTYVLAVGDRLVNFVEWSASLGCVVGAAWIAGKIGANRMGQRLASVFVVTLPMGIAQASSTMTDYVVAFWMICVASEVINFTKERHKISLFFLGLAIGLTFLTKATSAAYLFPFVIWIVISAFRYLGFRRSIIWGIIILSLVILINLGHLIRNQITYGRIFDQSMTASHQNELRNYQGIISNFVRNAGVHASTPWPRINDWLQLQILKIHGKLGIDMNDPRTTSAGEFHIGPPNYSEVGAVNPLHAVFMILIFIISVLLYKKSGKLNFLYVLSVLLTLITFSYLFKWQVFSSRYHLPLFVLFAPSFGYVLTRLIHRPTLNLIFGLLFLVTSTSWLFNIDARPLIPNSKSNLTVKSLFNDSRENWYFVSIASLDRYSMITTRIQEENCHNVGIMVSGAGAEYPFWVLLRMPRQDMRIEWDVVGTPSERYRDASFEPCAVICEDCPADWDSFKNKPKVIDNGYFQLFMRE